LVTAKGGRAHEQIPGRHEQADAADAPDPRM